MHEGSNSFIQSLDNLITSIIHINLLLEKDKELFVQNKIDQLTDSNDKKSSLINTLSEQLQSLKKYLLHPGDNLIQSIKNQMSSMNDQDQTKTSDLISKLQDNISIGYHDIVTNSQVINSNLNMIKDIWNKLIELSPEKNCVYEKPKQI